MSFTGDLLIFDTTLRDGLQGRTVDAKQRLAIFRALDEAGLDLIEIGVVSPKLEDISPIRKAGAAIKRARICVLAYPKADAIAQAGAALAGNSCGRLHVFNSVLVRDKGKSHRSETLDTVADTVRRARDLTDDIQWAALDASRADPDFVCQAVEIAISEGATTINLADTMGTMLPAEFGDLVAVVRDRVPNIDKAAIAVHCHNDLGLATANSLAGIEAGARQIECAVNGLGPRGGNTSLQEIVTVLNRRSDRFNTASKIEPTMIEPIGELVRAQVRPSSR